MTDFTYEIPKDSSDILADFPSTMRFRMEEKKPVLRVLSLFSGCGGMDLGFEGAFIAPAKSVARKEWIDHALNEKWVMLRKNRFQSVFANDILTEAEMAWTAYMSRFGYPSSLFRKQSVVELVKMHRQGLKVFPEKVDVVTGGFPCQDFSVAGKRKGFDSDKNDWGKKREEDAPSEETRGKLYYWMKQVIDIVKPKLFVAENVKGLVNLGDVKDIIQKDFASADGNGYIVLPPQVLNAGNYGVPESRERVIFIGIRKDALRKEALRALESPCVPEEYNPYPLPSHSLKGAEEGKLPFVTTADVLEDVREPADSADLSQQTYSKAKYLSNGSQGQTEIKLDYLGPTIRSEHHGNIEFRRLSEAHGGKHTAELSKGLSERRLTPRECALIQTFPPDYPFVSKKENGRGYVLSPSGAYKVIGNAVPPVLAYQIAKRLEEVWDELFFS